MSHLTKSLSVFILLLSLAFGSLMAQEPTPDAELEAPHDKKVSLSLEARGDYQRIYLGSQADKAILPLKPDPALSAWLDRKSVV